MRRMIITALIVVTASTAFLGGSTAGAGSTPMWSVYLKVASINSTVTLSPTGRLFDPNCPNSVCRFRYPAGTAVTLTAIAGPGSSWFGWQQLFTDRPTSCTGTRRACTLAMDSTKYVKAAFSPVQLWPNSNRGGHIDVEGGSGCGQGCYQFQYGTRATARAIDHDGYHFDRWTSTRCGSIKGAGCSFTMNDNNSISAYFARNDGLGQNEGPITVYVPFQATIRGTGTGTITGPLGLSCPGRCKIDYERGRQVTLTATATGGSRFVGWGSGVCEKAKGPTCVVRLVPTPYGKSRSASAWFN
jgi:hypothetical protein